MKFDLDFIHNDCIQDLYVERWVRELGLVIYVEDGEYQIVTVFVVKRFLSEKRFKRALSKHLKYFQYEMTSGNILVAWQDYCKLCLE